MRERNVESYLKRKVAENGGVTRKFKSPGRPNVPDQIVIWPPHRYSMTKSALVDFVETKAPGKRPRPGQVREHDRLRKLGCTVLVLDTFDKVDSYVRGCA